MTAYQLALLATRVAGAYLVLEAILGFVAGLGVISIWFGMEVGNVSQASRVQAAASAGTLLQLIVGIVILAKSTAIARFLVAEPAGQPSEASPGITQVVLLVTRLVALLMIAGGAYVLIVGLILAMGDYSYVKPGTPALAVSVPTILIGIVLAAMSRRIARWLAGE